MKNLKAFSCFNKKIYFFKKKNINCYLTLILLFSFSGKIFCSPSDFRNRSPDDFQFVWDEDVEIYRPFAANIKEECFFGDDFGLEGNIEKKYNWERSSISYCELKEKLIIAAQCVFPAISEKLVKRACGSMLEDVLDKKDHYNVKSSLSYLRSLQTKSAEQKLTQRVLSLISYDSLMRESVSQQDFKQLYDDLHFTCPEILIEARQSGAVNFVSFCLYQDDHRRIRIHLISPSNEEISEFPHNHYGPSGSIILSGSLVNQFLAVFPAKYNECADFGLYLLKKDGFTGENRRSGKTSFFQTNVNVRIISSHKYQRGDYYQLPTPRELDNNISINDKLTFHRVETKCHAVTLFSQEIERNKSHTTYPVGAPSVIYKKYFEASLSPEETFCLVQKIDRLVRKR